MNKQQAIEQLKDLRENQKSFIDDKEADLNGSIEIKLNKSGYKIRTCPP